VYRVDYVRKGSAVYSFTATDKLFPAGFTEVILGVVAFLAVSYYIGVITVRALEIDGYLHSFIISRLLSPLEYLIILSTAPPDLNQFLTNVHQKRRKREKKKKKEECLPSIQAGDYVI
jgi:hypothetical protein